MPPERESCQVTSPDGNYGPGGGEGGVLRYKGLMGTCGQPGYVFRDFYLKQGIDFINFCLKEGILKQQQNFYKIFRVKCLTQGIKNRNCLKQGSGSGYERLRRTSPTIDISSTPRGLRSEVQTFSVNVF